jgi:hypothetical protein
MAVSHPMVEDKFAGVLAMTFISGVVGSWRARVAPLAALAVLAAACGGGGGSSSDGPALTTLTLSGTAATGAAIAGAAVDVKCATGSATGTTQANGSYAITVASAAWPCVVRVTVAGGSPLHSVAVGSGAAATANITPMTQLFLASLFSTEPADAYARFNEAFVAAVMSAAVASAQSQVVALLRLAGVDFSALGDLLSGPLVPRTGTAAGDAYDQALDTLATTLAGSGTTLATLTTAAINASTKASPDPVPTLPAELLLRPATPTCAAMRSGTYRIITPTSNATMAAQSSLVVFDATTLGITRADGSTGTWTANGACRFTDQGAGYSADVVVSQAGVLAGRYTRDGGASYKTFVGFVEQTHAVAELAGQWNNMNVNQAGSVFVGNTGSATISAAGVVTAATSCENTSTWAVDVCADVGPTVLPFVPPFVANAGGGFDLIDVTTAELIGRVFAYQAGSSGLMLAGVGREGGFGFWTPNKSVSLPTVGAVRTSWNLDTTASLASASAIYLRSNTIVSVDTAAGSWLRTQKTPGTNNDHLETLFVDNPRAGFTFRAQGSSTGNDGSVQTINEFTALRLPGMGFGPALLSRLKLFEVFVVAP